MPPKKPPAKKPEPQVSKSQALVTTGPKEIVRKIHQSKRDADGHKPTTARALVLRNGKYGAMGTGEMMLVTKMSGREKLELLAEDLVARYTQALAMPFNANNAIKIAEAQYTSCLDEIQNLQDPVLFYHTIKSDAEARKPQLPPATGKKRQQRKDLMTDPSFIASVISSRIHNAYMFASAWRLVGLTLTENVDVERDSQIRDILKKDPKFRAQYLVLYDLITILVNFGQQKFAQLATTAPHWGQYFQVNQDKELDATKPEYIFSWEHLKSVHKSFLDSIVVELCLPDSTYPKQILIHILSEALDETPRDAKRFPQELWDAMGDLASTVQLLEVLETPLLGPEGEAWKKEERQMPEEFEKWVDAQLFSEKASRENANFQNMLVPIDIELKKAHVVETVWKYINLNYLGVSGKTIDALWGLDDVNYRKPSWHARKTQGKSETADGDDYDSDEGTALVPYGSKIKSKPKKPFLIASSGYESNQSMPSLQTISDSSEEPEEVSEDEGSDDGDDSDEESGEEDENYDEDEEDHLREMLREAMDMAAADPDFYNPRREAAYFKEAAEEKRDNSFIKLLGSLRGRMFTANPSLKTSTRGEPRQPYTGPKPSTSAYTPAQPFKPAAKTPSTPQKEWKFAATQPQTKNATVEEVSDEDEPSTTPKKKKKKPKKKKKKASATAEGVTAESNDGGTGPVIEEVSPQPSPAPAPAPAPAAPTSPQQQQKTPVTPKTPTKKAPVLLKGTATVSTLPAHASTASLPIQTEQIAQSARSYLQKEGLAAEKAKTKTRSDQPTMFSIPEKRSIFSRLTGKKDKAKERKQDAAAAEGDKHSFLSRMSKKTKNYMHQLLHSSEDEKQGIAPLKWEHFVKVMREMGFSIDPSTAGSSVRFDPPDPRDPSITFHKPHPDPTLQPFKVREFGRRLTRTYGWSEADFYIRAVKAS
ncbi:hypothetical protein BC835DRAFT_1271539 [Cytidiella melzeri]|nr:hypothetical protein BC835DRAFT_1271539 [Cytidiella melzeri]